LEKCLLKVSGKFEFTNAICTCFDKKYCDFETCLLKSVNRSYKYFSGRVNLFKKPVTKAKVNVCSVLKIFYNFWYQFQLSLGLFKRFNGYKPFMYNYTLDLCRFLKNPKAYPIADFFYGLLREHSNLNHTCPYNVSVWN